MMRTKMTRRRERVEWKQIDDDFRAIDFLFADLEHLG